MKPERVSIKLIEDLRHIGGPTHLQQGSELLVHTTTAAALVLCGAAVQLPVR